MAVLKLKLLDGNFSIHHFDKSAEIPAEVFKSSFFNISKTDDELSVVCSTSLELNSKRSDRDWACIKVIGPFTLEIVGIIAKLSRILAEAQISIFTISTYETDYIFVKSSKANEAVSVLETAGYEFT